MSSRKDAAKRATTTVAIALGISSLFMLAAIGAVVGSAYLVEFVGSIVSIVIISCCFLITMWVIIYWNERKTTEGTERSP